MRRQFKMLAALATILIIDAVQAAPVSGQGTWETTLKARDVNGKAVALGDSRAAFFFDSALNVTWLADMNSARGTAFDQSLQVGATDSIGAMTWEGANAWVNSLAYVGEEQGKWRLPSVRPVNGNTFNYEFSTNGSTDFGYARTYDDDPATSDAWGLASELGHLYYVTLGNVGGCIPNDASPQDCVNVDPYARGLGNTGFFRNLEEAAYWSGTGTDWNSDPSLPSGLRKYWYFFNRDGSQGWANLGNGYLGAAVRDGDVLVVPEPSVLLLVVIAMAGLTVPRLRK